MGQIKTIERSIQINASKDKVWDILFNRFGEVNVFNPVIEGSHFTKGNVGEVGCERQCDLDAKNSVIEKITEVRGSSGFNIEIIKGGLPMMNRFFAEIDLESLSGDKTLVRFKMNFIAKPAFMAFMMKIMLRKMLLKVLLGMKFYLETGKQVSKENFPSIQKTFDANGGFEAFLQTAAA